MLNILATVLLIYLAVVAVRWLLETVAAWWYWWKEDRKDDRTHD